MWFRELQGVIMILAAAVAVAADAEMKLSIAKDGCSDRCGDVSIPFPFGTSEGCYLNSDFFINCSQTAPLLTRSDIEIKSVSLVGGQLTVMQFAARRCYARNGTLVLSRSPMINFARFTVSSAANKFVVVGCDTTGSVFGRRHDGRNYSTGCTATCGGEDDVENGSCTGLGCCATSIPRNVRRVNITMGSRNKYRDVWDFNDCGYAFVVEEAAFAFSLEELRRLRNVTRLPMVVDWAIGDGNCHY